jgi:hypothetical protein
MHLQLTDLIHLSAVEDYDVLLKVDPTAETENIILNLFPDGFRVSLTRHFPDSFFYNVLTFLETHLDYQFV